MPQAYEEWLKSWNLIAQEHGEKTKRAWIYYAAPKPYKHGFITSPTLEGRTHQLRAAYESTICQ